MRRRTILPTGRSAVSEAAELAPHGEYALAYPFTEARMSEMPTSTASCPPVTQPNAKPPTTAPHARSTYDLTRPFLFRCRDASGHCRWDRLRLRHACAHEATHIFNLLRGPCSPNDSIGVDRNDKGRCGHGIRAERCARRAIALISMALYAMIYGISEATGRTYPAPPGLLWQVPSAWVRPANAWQRIAIWGSVLGHGFITINPYAGFGLLVLTLASVGNRNDGLLLGASIGALHGMARSLALLRDARGRNPIDYKEAMRIYRRRQNNWRNVDGVLLLVIGGLAVVVCIHRFG